MRDKILLKMLAISIVLVIVVSCTMMLIETVSAVDITDQFLEEHYGYIVNPDSVIIDIVNGDNDSVLLGHEIIFNGSTEVEIRGIEGTSTEGVIDCAGGTTDLTGDGIIDTEFDTRRLMEGLYNVTDWINTETLTVDDPLIMDLRLKVGTEGVSSLTASTPLRINFTSKLDDNDCVDLRIIDPNGIRLNKNPADPAQEFNDINVSRLLEYGSMNVSKQINTTGWEAGTWTFYVKTNPQNARGLDVCSAPMALTVSDSEGEIVVHNIDTGENFSLIQAAIVDQDTMDGHTIIVDPGTHVENVDVYKSLTIRSTSGNPEDTIVQAKNTDDHVFAVTADYVNISGFMVKGATGYEAGIYINANYCDISNNIISNNHDGIYFYYSNNNEITNNNANSNNDYGIRLYHSNSNTVTNNNANSNEWKGISLSFSNNNTITSNNASLNHDEGILIWYSDNNEIMNNNASLNNWAGIRLWYSNNSTITNNNVSNNTEGIDLIHSNNNEITNNNASLNNWIGIYLWYSNNSTITNNNVSNNDIGIEPWDSNNNIIYFNNFINNTDNFHSSDSTNIWNSTSKITYTYNGSTYTNYLGNYWSDYTDLDTNNDGIWDNPRSIDGDKDNYPLVEPWEYYFKPLEEKIFDTGSPANPYPSIFGTHNGTIKPNVTIEVSTLYTHPCAGTGGHTESIRIWNKTRTIAEGNWTGYSGDWYNITSPTPFTLEAGKEYNYTIRTGSYPQIHHTPALPTANGWINCTSFIDANGRVYYDWIPAIRLGG